ncbi:MAG: hypothetical protein RIQ93_2492 [Verrucomicrobiota bacterium]|jgi:RNA polymerase sigma factor (sigma-70 family)
MRPWKTARVNGPLFGRSLGRWPASSTSTRRRPPPFRRAWAVAADNPENDDTVVAIHEALEKFAALDSKKAELVKLRYFAGLTIEECGHALGVSEPTAKRWWAYARAWLLEEIKQHR